MKMAYLVAALVLGSACATQKLMRQAEGLLVERKFDAALSVYEQVLTQSPNHQRATTQIQETRRQMVIAELAQCQDRLSSGDIPAALGHAMEARRMPLNLDDVELLRRIDAAIHQASQQGEERVRQWLERGHFVPALELARRVAEASPHSRARAEWAQDVSRQALQHYSALADKLGQLGLHGAAALQLSLAKHVGADVTPTRVLRRWTDFAEPVCFAEPGISIEGADGALREVLSARARLVVDEVRQRCGEGARPLKLTLVLSDVELRDQIATEQIYRPLPGSKVQTEEVYTEEVPYEEEDEVVTYETRVEKKERRDCAPRPGQERGCRTWLEDQEVQVPIKKTQLVQKVRKVEQRRALPGPFPENEVLSYPLTTVDRGVRFNAQVLVDSKTVYRRTFSVLVQSQDTSHPEAKAKGYAVRADDLDVKSMEVLQQEAAEKLGSKLSEMWTEIFTTWATAIADEARQLVVEGQHPQAEELFLKLLALGIADVSSAQQFFQDRYGLPIGKVFYVLGNGLGRQAGIGGPSDNQRFVFPKRTKEDVAKLAEAKKAPTPAPVSTYSRMDTLAEQSKATEYEKPVSDAAIEDLEAASLAEPGAKPVPLAPAGVD